MGQYILHSVKYMFKLIVLLAILFVVMDITGTAANGSVWETLQTRRGALLLAAILLLAAVYPGFGFVSRRIDADMDADRDKIMAAFAMGGYEPAGSDDGRMVFRMGGTLRRAFMLWEDPVTITRNDKGITMSGIRTQVVKAEYRLKAMI